MLRWILHSLLVTARLLYIFFNVFLTVHHAMILGNCPT